MKTETVPSSWLYRDDRRFDAGPYTSGALEAKLRLDELSLEKNRLREVTLGGMTGLVNPGRIKRLWVTDSSYGKPFLSSTDILQADLSAIRYISNRAVEENPKLLIKKGSTLVTRAGTIGRMCYVRSDMDSMACTEDVLRVIPDEAKIPSGYLFAFLSGRFGVPLVTSGTYGAIIQHIEPEHIADLPVPRLGYEIEQRVHKLTEEAAVLRVQANRMLSSAIAATLEIWGVEDLSSDSSHPDVQIVSASRLASFSRFDASFYSAKATSSDELLSRIGWKIPIQQLGRVVSGVFETPRFGRVTVEDQAYGVPFLSISNLVRFDPRTEALISKRQADDVNALVKKGWLVLPRVGQIQGVFGTVCFIPEHLDGVSVSDNNIRIVPSDEETGAYLWAALSTRICYLQVIRRACGTSIPYLDAKRVADIPIPWPAEPQRQEIAAQVKGAMVNRSLAVTAEDKARGLVEHTIENVI